MLLPSHLAITWWLTGLPAAGKTTLAYGLRDHLAKVGQSVVVLDGDELRTGLCADLDFSPAARSENMRRVAEVAKLFNRNGIAVAVALVSPFQAARQHARQIIGAERFIEVFVSTPLEVCQQRDPKGLYAQASRNPDMQLTGVSARYETPESPDVTIDTSIVHQAAAIQTLLTSAELK